MRAPISGMMRARPGWIVAMSSMVIEFLPLQKVSALTFSSSSFSVMSDLPAWLLARSARVLIVVLPSRLTSPAERPVRVPRALALEGARRLQHEIVAVARGDDLHADRQAARATGRRAPSPPGARRG